MRLFKSRKSAEHSNISSVVAIESDSNVTIVSCSPHQNNHNNNNNNPILSNGKNDGGNMIMISVNSTIFVGSQCICNLLNVAVFRFFVIRNTP